MKPGQAGIDPSPRPAQSTAHQTILTPSQAEHGLEGGFVLQPQVPSSSKSSSQHQAPVSIILLSPKREFLSLRKFSPTWGCGHIPLMPRHPARWPSRSCPRFPHAPCSPN